MTLVNRELLHPGLCVHCLFYIDLYLVSFTLLLPPRLQMSLFSDTVFHFNYVPVT